MLTRKKEGSTLDVSTMMIQEVMSDWPYVPHHVWDCFHSDECGFFGWACITRPRIHAGTLWEYDRIVYRIDSGVGLGAFSSERSLVHPEESLISFHCLLRGMS